MIDTNTPSPQHFGPLALIMWAAAIIFHTAGKILGMIHPVPAEINSWLEAISFVGAIIVSVITIARFILSIIHRKNKKNGTPT